MKKFLMIGLLWTSVAFGHGDAAPAGVGPGKGVEYYDEHEGFTLSKEAIRNFEMKTVSIREGKACDLSRAEKVQVLNDRKVYRVRDAKIQSVEPQCRFFQSGDQVVIHGAPFLRVVEMDLQSGEEEEHEEEGEAHHD